MSKRSWSQVRPRWPRRVRMPGTAGEAAGLPAAACPLLARWVRHRHRPVPMGWGGGANAIKFLVCPSHADRPGRPRRLAAAWVPAGLPRRSLTAKAGGRHLLGGCPLPGGGEKLNGIGGGAPQPRAGGPQPLRVLAPPARSHAASVGAATSAIVIVAKATGRNAATLARLLCVAAVAVAAGCVGTTPSRFYLLHADVALQPAPPSGSALVIGLQTVRIPHYLDRPQIVTRGPGNQIRLAEFDRWAEPLQENIQRVLARNLSTLLGAEAVLAYPWQGAPRFDGQLAVQLERFDSGPDAIVKLDAVWSLYSGDGRDVLAIGQARIAVPVPAEAIPDMVAAGNRAVAQLAQQLADAIGQHCKPARGESAPR